MVPLQLMKIKCLHKVKEENLNECNNAIQIPKFKIEKGLKVGDNLVEFTPKETGEFAPKATGAQGKAFNIISNTNKKDHIAITVKGILTGETRASQSENAINYQVIKLASITEN